MLGMAVMGRLLSHTPVSRPSGSYAMLVVLPLTSTTFVGCPWLGSIVVVVVQPNGLVTTGWVSGVGGGLDRVGQAVGVVGGRGVGAPPRGGGGGARPGAGVGFGDHPGGEVLPAGFGPVPYAGLGDGRGVDGGGGEGRPVEG